jgi:predicted RNA-binding protein associated with RNAse of E/G family
MELDLTTIVTLAGLFLGGAVTAYTIVKKKIHDFRILVDDLDEALYDDKITPEEFNKIFDHARRLIIMNYDDKTPG